MDTILRYKKIKRRIKVRSNENEKENLENAVSNDEEIIGHRVIKEILSSKKKLFVSLLIFRIINSFINHASYVPDEYWQSVEVAHKWIFKIGYLTWEWLPENALRSPLYPLLFAVPFKILQFLNLDNRVLLIKLPMIIHGFIAALTDFYLYIFSLRLAGQQVAQWTLFHQLVNWFTVYSCTRTLVNNIEWFLVMIFIHEFQMIVHRPFPLSRRLLFFASISTILRPTGLVFLIPVCLYHLVTVCESSSVSLDRSIIKKSFINGFVVGGLILSVSLFLEKHFYGKWTCSQLNFLHFNLLTDVSQTYGVHPWHWYFTNALPAMFTTQIIILFVAVWSQWNDRTGRCMIAWMGIVLHIYSYLGHKEFRFIFPIMPVAMHLMGRVFVQFPSKRKVMVWFLLITQVPMSFYMSLLHQRGGNDVVMAIGRHIEQQQISHDNLSAVFLMPCHSTPWYSHMHYNISARFLTCDPQITGGISLTGDEPLKPSVSLKNYDEADLFYKDPEKWLLVEYSSATDRPVFWIMFDQLNPEVQHILTLWNYSICKKFFHTHFPTHRRHSTKILVYCKRNYFL